MLEASGINTGFGGMARAKAYAETLNLAIIKGVAERRAKIGIGHGERAPMGPARGADVLVEIREGRGAGGRVKRKTSLGYKTARKRLPRVLEDLPENDPRRMAAEQYAHAAEKIGSVAGMNLGGAGGNQGDGPSDGGAATRMQHVALVRDLEFAIAWERDTETGAILRGRADYALSPSNRRGDRLPIRSLELVRRVCLNGESMRDILRAHGWSGHRRDCAHLKKRAEDLLELMAIQIGLLRK